MKDTDRYDQQGRIICQHSYYVQGVQGAECPQCDQEDLEAIAAKINYRMR